MRRGKSGIHSCRLTPERGVRYGLRRCKIAIEVPSKIVILAGADSPLKFLYFPSSFLEGFPPSSSFGFSFFFSLFTIVFIIPPRTERTLFRFFLSFFSTRRKEKLKRSRKVFFSSFLIFKRKKERSLKTIVNKEKKKENLRIYKEIT